MKSSSSSDGETDGVTSSKVAKAKSPVKISKTKKKKGEVEEEGSDAEVKKDDEVCAEPCKQSFEQRFSCSLSHARAHTLLSSRREREIVPHSSPSEHRHLQRPLIFLFMAKGVDVSSPATLARFFFCARSFSLSVSPPLLSLPSPHPTPLPRLSLSRSLYACVCVFMC